MKVTATSYGSALKAVCVTLLALFVCLEPAVNWRLLRVLNPFSSPADTSPDESETEGEGSTEESVAVRPAVAVRRLAAAPPSGGSFFGSRRPLSDARVCAPTRAAQPAPDSAGSRLRC